VKLNTRVEWESFSRNCKLAWL